MRWYDEAGVVVGSISRGNCRNVRLDPTLWNPHGHDWDGVGGMLAVRVDLVSGRSNAKLSWVSQCIYIYTVYKSLALPPS